MQLPVGLRDVIQLPFRLLRDRILVVLVVDWRLGLLQHSKEAYAQPAFL